MEPDEQKAPVARYAGGVVDQQLAAQLAAQLHGALNINVEGPGRVGCPGTPVKVRGRSGVRAVLQVLVVAVGNVGLETLARQDSAEHFSRLKVQRCTAMGWIFIPAYCFAIP